MPAPPPHRTPAALRLVHLDFASYPEGLRRGLPELALPWVRSTALGHGVGVRLDRTNMFLLIARHLAGLAPRPRRVLLRGFAHALRIPAATARALRDLAAREADADEADMRLEPDYDLLIRKLALLAIADGQIDGRETDLLASFARRFCPEGGVVESLTAWANWILTAPARGAA